MSIIRQGSLFDLQELYDLEPTQRFEAVFSAVDLHPVLHVVMTALIKHTKRLNTRDPRNVKTAL